MAMIGANLSIPAISVLKPGEALPTDLLAQDLGDAGGLKWYHDASGVLLDNDLGGNSYAYRKDAYYWNGAAWVYGGFLTEEQGTNEIRNSTMQGGEAGSIGVPPTNWSMNDPAGDGLTRELNYGLEDGIEYVDIRVFGTTTSDGTFITRMEDAGAASALFGEDWTVSGYLKLAAGSLAGIDSIFFQLQQYDAGVGFLSSQTSPVINLTTALTRFGFTATLDEPTVAFVQPLLNFSYSTGTAIDFTLRIGLPQSEENDHAMSVIKTYLAAATRVADLGQVIGQELVGAEGSIVAEIRPYIAVNKQYVFKARAADDQDFVALFVDGTGQATIEHSHGGAYAINSFTGKALSDETVHRIAMSWDGAGLSVSVDGLTTESVAVTGAFAQALLENYYGARESGLDPYNGFIPSLVAYDYKMDATELENRST